MNLSRLIAAAVVLSALGAAAQTTLTSGQTLVVMPFENRSDAPGLEWIGESVPELLEGRLDSPTLYVLSREDRLRAYDRLGIPMGIHPSHATIYRMAEQMDVDYVLLGTYSFDGRTFTARAKLLDMRREHILPEMVESAPLVQLIDIETALAWDVLHALHPDLSTTRQAYMEAAPPVRLDAFENYVRGIVASAAPEQTRRFREAVRLNPEYPEALLRLGKAYYRERQYDQAALWLAKVQPAAPEAREANFYLGLAAYYLADYARAEAAFEFVAARLPLIEVYNNLGVVIARQGKRNSSDYFQKAVDADPNDPDYRFNLGVALYRAGNLPGASRQLREAVALRPGDGEAKSLLDAISGTGHARNSAANGKTPLERIRSNYEEGSFRQLALKIDAVAEQRLSRTDPHAHAQFHADRGRELLAQGFAAEAEGEFRESIHLDPENAQSHAGLARVLELNQNFAGARSEAETALRLHPSADSLLVLARADLRDNRAEAAADKVDQALRLEPSNNVALALKRAVAAKLAEKAQPLPNR